VTVGKLWTFAALEIGTPAGLAATPVVSTRVPWTSVLALVHTSRCCVPLKARATFCWLAGTAESVRSVPSTTVPAGLTRRP
jgi:hypothetical protein